MSGIKLIFDARVTRPHLVNSVGELETIVFLSRDHLLVSYLDNGRVRFVRFRLLLFFASRRLHYHHPRLGLPCPVDRTYLMMDCDPEFRQNEMINS